MINIVLVGVRIHDILPWAGKIMAKPTVYIFVIYLFFLARWHRVSFIISYTVLL